LSISPFVHPTSTIQKSKFKNRNPTITKPFSSVFIYKKRDERDREEKEERNKKQRRETEAIKT
jgi:hypothetical protein